MNPDPLPNSCRACGTLLSPEDNYCRNCGKGRGGKAGWQYKPLGVIAMTLLVGPFSLFYVWRSQVISRGAKLAFSAGILFFTYFVVERFYRVWQFYNTLLGGVQVY
ncbi:MAG TPA: hypothetical protein DEQ38_14830 [Elusimicrobia bacterium]|nr:hypothetical protein [Elusimicrobiota bacterium]